MRNGRTRNAVSPAWPWNNTEYNIAVERVLLTGGSGLQGSMKVIRSVKVATEKYFRNSIRAYFEREAGCDLRWIAEILRSSPVQARSILETCFSQYAPTERYRDLIGRL